MTVQELYAAIGGDYEDAIRRLRGDDKLAKFLSFFLADRSFATLKDALAKEDYVQAFSSAHTIKGVALNLSLKRLAEVDAELTELLRPQKANPEIGPAFAKLEQVYNQVCQAIHQLVDSLPSKEE